MRRGCVDQNPVNRLAYKKLWQTKCCCNAQCGYNCNHNFSTLPKMLMEYYHYDLKKRKKKVRRKIAFEGFSQKEFSLQMCLTVSLHFFIATRLGFYKKICLGFYLLELGFLLGQCLIFMLTYLPLFSNVGPECGISMSNREWLEDNSDESLHTFEMFFHFWSPWIYKWLI